MNNAIDTLAQLNRIDSGIQQFSSVPSLLIELQEEKLSLILASLVASPIESLAELGCLELPEFLKGKYKTIGYYGQRHPLLKALFYYKNQLDEPIGNVYRTCNNFNCLNLSHATIGKKTIEDRKFSGKFKRKESKENRENRELIEMEQAMKMESTEEKERRIELELERQEQEIFEHFAK